LQSAAGKAPRGGPREAYLAIERFLKASRKPALMEAGEDPLPLAMGSFALSTRAESVTLECWSGTRNLVRRLRGLQSERRGRVEIEVERFGGRTGTITLVDLDDPSNREAGRRGARLKYRERFRQALHRQYPDWRLVELSTDPDLHHTLSPAYPRALLRKGSIGLAAIGAAEDALSPEGALSFGLIWLDYLRRRESKAVIEGLAIFLPADAERTTCHRVRLLNPEVARYSVFVHHPGGHEDAVEPRDYANFTTRLDPCHRPLGAGSNRLVAWVERISAIDGVENRQRRDGSVSLAVRGLEFARTTGDDLLFGLDHQHIAGGEGNIAEIEELARGLARMRSADAADPANPLYRRHPEAWLESQIRLHLDRLDPSLHVTPIYGQVPQFTAGDRSLIDLLAVDRSGQLAVIEVKEDQDIHLPLQALDYWMHVKWHLDRGDFAGRGYFPGLGLRSDAPRLLLVAPALDYHPSNETVLRYFSPEVPVERIGVGIQWRRELKVMFRVPSVPWPSPYSARSNEPFRA